MPKLFFALILTICSHALLIGQTPKTFRAMGSVEPPPANNNLYLEVGGSFVWLGGINYERVVIRKNKFLMVIRAGLGLDLLHWESSGIAVPIGASLNFGNTNYFELRIDGGTLTTRGLQYNQRGNGVGDMYIYLNNSSTANPSVLWPPNHKMQNVLIEVGAQDLCSTSVSCKIVDVESSEPQGSPGTNKKQGKDIEVNGPLSVSLRSERLGTEGNGRSYTITVECVDATDSNASYETVVVEAPHDRRK